MATAADLANLKQARSALIAQMSNGEKIILEFEIRGKRTVFESPLKMLETIESLIRTCTEELSASAGNRARNRARTMR